MLSSPLHHRLVPGLLIAGAIALGAPGLAQADTAGRVPPGPPAAAPAAHVRALTAETGRLTARRHAGGPRVTAV